jgi:hypothetical protein
MASEMIFERKVTTGNIIEIFVLIIGVVIFATTANSKIDSLQDELSRANKRIEGHEERYVRKDVMEQVLVQLNDIKQDLKDIKRDLK